jgi:hypothetical protein
MSRLVTPAEKTWTARVRARLGRALPLEHLLPDHQPAYVGSWVYIFGVATIGALVWVIASGIVLSFFGPQWWHASGIGRFFNSMHERNRALSRADLALAIHPVVPGAADQHRSQCGPAGDGHHGATNPAADPGAIHPRNPQHPTIRADPPPDLAQVLPGGNGASDSCAQKLVRVS